MATSFPTSIDAFSNPSASDPQDSPSHAAQHTNKNDAIEAIEAKVGADSSAVTTSHDYLIAKLRHQDLNTQTDSYTLVLTDDGKIVEQNKASANDLTVPPNSSVAFPVGTRIDVVQVGAGATTIVAGSGVTVNKNALLTLVMNGQWSVVTLYKRATNTWVVAGDLVPA